MIIPISIQFVANGNEFQVDLTAEDFCKLLNTGIYSEYGTEVESHIHKPYAIKLIKFETEKKEEKEEGEGEKKDLIYYFRTKTFGLI